MMAGSSREPAPVGPPGASPQKDPTAVLATLAPERLAPARCGNRPRGAELPDCRRARRAIMQQVLVPVVVKIYVPNEPWNSNNAHGGTDKLAGWAAWLTGTYGPAVLRNHPRGGGRDGPVVTARRARCGSAPGAVPRGDTQPPHAVLSSQVGQLDRDRPQRVTVVQRAQQRPKEPVDQWCQRPREVSAGCKEDLPILSVAICRRVANV